MPISHGEGRFVCPPELLRRLAEAGQVATQYVDPEGRPTMDIRYNPNGSAGAVEGLLSPDGRVFGRMGHEAVMASWLLSLFESSAFSVCHKKEAMSSPQISLILSIVWHALGYSAHTSCSIPLNCAPCPENKNTYFIPYSI